MGEQHFVTFISKHIHSADVFSYFINLVLQIINVTQVVNRCICVNWQCMLVFSMLLCDPCIANCVFSLAICIIVTHLVEIWMLRTVVLQCISTGLTGVQCWSWYYGPVQSFRKGLVCLAVCKTEVDYWCKMLCVQIVSRVPKRN